MMLLVLASVLVGVERWVRDSTWTHVLLAWKGYELDPEALLQWGKMAVDDRPSRFWPDANKGDAGLRAVQY